MSIRRQAIEKQIKRSRLLVCLISLLLALASAVHAVEPEPPETVIRAQLQALSDNDAEGAYAFASDGIKTMFASPEVFIDMVRNQYSALIQPRSLSFSESRPLSSTLVIQEVQLLDRQGESWRAIYRLGLADDEWRIEGVSLVNINDQAV